ncbi:MAG: site-specific DNA-methyltransferase [Candidatus Pacebacteria bacterium]|nr:site-specific DNA-methyltransferase [Candidatus Paceibacterota bacterium]
MNNFKQKLINILKKEPDFTDIETEEINYNKVKDSADKIDEKLISLLIQDKEIKEKFFTKIKDVYVFNIKNFKFFLDENKIDNSYTQYENRIGLATNKGLLKDDNEVVLNWPYKDCLLEGGQSTEEGMDNYFEYSSKKEEYEEKQAKRKEIFFNEVLAQDEIDRLLDDKAFVNWKKYTKNGEQEVKGIERDENGIIKENLIIKGNNLLALHSLKKQFSEKIKLIYIDPPYNTGGDANSFTYNNTFNHSTWLTFMKNRLEIAKTFLRQDGFIAIAIDHCELFYLGAIADEIFRKENRVGIISIVIKPEGRQFSKFFSVTNEYMLVYAKNKELAKFENVILDEKLKQNFKFQDEKGNYKLRKYINYNPVEISGRQKRPNFWYPFYVKPDLSTISTEKQNNWIEVFPIENSLEKTWQTNKQKAQERIQSKDIICLKNKKGGLEIFYKVRESQRFLTHWIDSKYNTTAHGTRLVGKLISEKNVSYPKSLYTILDTIKIMTKKDDIILDFFAGSGTTAHAVLESNKENDFKRRFILIEQLEEHINVCKERLIKILDKDDSFIYSELAKWNEDAKEKIKNCKSLKDLEKLFEELYEKYFLNYNVKTKEFKEKIIKEENFKELSLEEQKKMFLAMLDLNQIYVQKSEMSDNKFGISEKDQKLTEEFYKNI